MSNNMPLLIKRFIDYINEEYELAKKIQSAAPGNPKVKLPYHLDDHAILALADDPENSKYFVELMINGDKLCLEYGDAEGVHDVSYNFQDYADVHTMIVTAYQDWQKKVADLHLTIDDISVDEFAK